MTTTNPDEATPGTRELRPPALLRVGIPLFVLVASASVYLATMSRSLAYNDSGEISVVCATLGIMHPTGYPLYTLLGYLWTRLPIPVDPALKLNILAAICASVSVVFFYLSQLRLFALLRLKDDRPASASPQPAAIAASLVYAFSHTVWMQATAMETYSLALLLFTLCAWVVLEWAMNAKASASSAAACGFSTGLMFTNHMTMLFALPSLAAAWLTGIGGKANAIKLALISIAAATLPLILYAYLPLRSGGYWPFTHLGKPYEDWGETGRGFHYVLYHVAAREFRNRMFHGGTQSNIGVAFDLIPSNLTWAGAALALYGITVAWTRHRPAFFFLSLLILCPTVFASNYKIPNIEWYYALAFLGLFWSMGAGLADIIMRRPRFGWASLAIPVVLLGTNFGACNRAPDHLVDDYCHNLAAGLNPRPIVLTSQWEYVESPLWYYQKVDGYRQDIAIVDTNLVDSSWYLDQLRRRYPNLIARSLPQFTAQRASVSAFEHGHPFDHQTSGRRRTDFLGSLICNNWQDRPIYVTEDIVYLLPGCLHGARLVPVGLADRIVPTAPVQCRDCYVPQFDRFLATPIDSGQPESVRITQYAAAELGHAAGYQLSLGNSGDAGVLKTLSDRLNAKANLAMSGSW